jgi:two-component system, NarL family, sensor histidine kinase UhpB
MTVSPFVKKIILLAAIFNYWVIAFSQKTIPALKAELETLTSAKAKANICLEIAERYTSALKIDSAIYFANKIKEYSQQGDYETGTGMYHLAFANALYYRNRHDELEENVVKAIEIFVRQKQTVLLGRSHLILGNSQLVNNNIFLARKNYWTAAGLYEISGNSNGLYSTYWWLARSYYKTSQIDSASFYYIKALSLAERLNDPEKVFISGSWVATTFLSLGELGKAVRYFDYALKSRTPESGKVGTRSFLTDYATALILTHEFGRADSIIKEIELVNGALKDAYGSVLVNGLRGTLEYERKNYKQAVVYLTDASNKKEELKIWNNKMRDFVLLLGKAEYEAHSYESAITNLEAAARMSRELRELTDEGEAYLLISKAFQQKGNADSALYYFKNYSVLKDSVLSQQKQKNIIEVAARYESAKKEQEIKTLEAEKEANSYLMQLKNQQIVKQELEDEKKSQQLTLLSQQNEISRLEAVQKNLALQNQGKEIIKNKNELDLLSKESQLQATVAAKEKLQKRFAFAAVFAILFFGVIILYRYRRSHQLGKQLAVSLQSLREAQDQLVKTEKEKEAENVRVRISRDIHDEVGATLSGVALFSEIAKQKMEQHRAEDAQVYLNHISANSKEMVEKMSDIVWAINPDNDSFERIIAKLQSYAFNLCAGKGISLHLDTDGEMQHDYPVMQVKRNLYLFMKEAVNNAVKYSEGKNIFLSLKKMGDTIIAEVRDDGKGFDMGSINMGNGLKNMKERADSLGGVLTIDSRSGAGTSIRLKFQFHLAGGQSLAV